MNSPVCPACGKNNLVAGNLQSTGTLHFRPTGVKFMTFRTADITVCACMCRDCGQIHLQGDLEKLRLVQDLPGVDEKSRTPAPANR